MTVHLLRRGSLTGARCGATKSGRIITELRERVTCRACLERAER